MRHLIVSLIFAVVVLGENVILDSDGDLVPDSIDLCPNTSENVTVDKFGCRKTIEKILYFDLGQTAIKLDQYYIIEDIINLAKELKGYKIYIQGHADATSSAAVNLEISKQRAMNVFRALAKELDKSRIVISWYGESQPVASNVTKEGKSQNRRVSIHLR